MRKVCHWIIAIAVAGCGRGETTADVAGIVTLDGEPLADAFVTFQPEAGSPIDSSKGKTDSAGHFTLTRVSDERRGAVVGDHRVFITTVTPELAEKMADSATLPPDRVPAKYQGGTLTFKVPSGGTSEANFDLNTR